MGNIFGDTDDITFGSDTPSSPPRQRVDRSPLPLSRPSPTPHRDRPPRVRPQMSSSSGSPRKPTPATPPETFSIATSLMNLIGSMKPTFLPPSSGESMKVILLSSHKERDPLLLVRQGDSTLLIGTGFSTLENAGKTYPTFPDMRLVESEKDHLAGWVILNSGFDATSFQMMLEMLGFPFVYGTREVIAYIRDNIKDMQFLDKCRFFELFSPGVDDRKVAEFHLKNTSSGLSISVGNKGFIDGVHMIDSTALSSGHGFVLSSSQAGYHFTSEAISFLSGEIIDILGTKLVKNAFKFTFDVFYRDAHSIGVVAGYALKDREELSENGVLTFVLEEDARARAIVGHIFIDSRGFVHAYEMMHVHKQILKGIRHIYEDSIIANPRIERAELVQTLRRELTKYCYLITGRTPVVMPIIIER